jgi:two-component system nitrate/nitrite response regulator NarL
VPATALLVDDHPGLRRLARRLLEAAGLVVVAVVGDGASALAAVEVFRPDVVLLDVLLPDTTGFEVARACSPP